MDPPTCTANSALLILNPLSNARMNIYDPDFIVNPLKNALVIDTLKFGLGVLKLTNTETVFCLSPLKSKINRYQPAVMAPTKISCLADAINPALQMDQYCG